MKKLLALFFTFLVCLNVEAKKFDNAFNSIINDSGISKASVSVSIKNLETSKTYFNWNENILMHPASVQKILTLPAFMDVLGENYQYTTALYYENNGDYLIKLGADPFLESSDLKTLIKTIDKKRIKRLLVDDSVIEIKSWGEGWQWDDDLNTSMPRFNAYNLDGNLIKLTVMPQNDKTIIINPSKYPFIFVNNVKVSSNSNKLNITRNSLAQDDSLVLSGTLSGPQTIFIPVNNPKKYFKEKLNQVLENRNIYLKENFVPAKKSDSAELIAEVNHPLTDAEDEILKNSNNMMIESTMKLAAAKAYNTQGTDTSGIKIFNNFCKKLGIDNSRVRLVDASGVSKNNLVDANFVTDYLIKIQYNPVIKRMAKPGEGTLKDRMLPLSNNLQAKTGTLSDISSIAGYITSKKGNKYAFCIIINDPQSNNSTKKSFEDHIIREIFFRG